MYIAYISVSKPTPWAVAGPHGQLASTELVALHGKCQTQEALMRCTLMLNQIFSITWEALFCQIHQEMFESVYCMIC